MVLTGWRFVETCTRPEISKILKYEGIIIYGIRNTRYCGKELQAVHQRRTVKNCAW